MFVYDTLGSLAPSDVQKCAKGVTYTEGPKYLPGFGAGETASADKKTNWVPIVVGAAVVGAVVWWATSGMQAANPGRAKKLGVTARDVDPEQLHIGTEHELEHTDDRRVARQIALDHLAETPDYYMRLASIEPAGNPRGPTAEQWNKLRVDYLEADRAYDTLDSELSYKYGSKHGYEWASTTERKKLEQLRKRKDRIGEKMFVILDKVSPRDWHHGVPAHWIYSKLSWEDAIRPANEPLSVAPPTAYGY